MPGYRDAYGGVPVGEAYGEVVQNTRPYGVGLAADSLVLAGGPAWVDAPVLCAYTMKDSGWPCENEALKDTDHCLGHRRASVKAHKLAEG